MKVEPGAPARELLTVVIGGHVDHGKSTIIGRLLADTQSLPAGKLEQVRALCIRQSKPFEYSFLLDALRDERAQGITIETARVFLKTLRRDYLLFDAPGHIEFVKNLVTGAAQSHAAFLVVDAGEGIRENSRRHAHLIAMLGIRHVAVLVNKMDLVGYSRETFDRIAAEYVRFLDQIGIAPAAIIPVSGRSGENVVDRSAALDWHQGPTVLDLLESFPSATPDGSGPFRLPVQDVYKFTGQGDDRRIVAGTIEAGTAAVGDEVVFYPSGSRSRIKTFESFNGSRPDSATAGQAIGFTLEDQIYVARGELAGLSTERRPEVSTRLRVTLFWLGRSPLTRRTDYILKLGSARVTAQVEHFHRVMNGSDLTPIDNADRVERHQIAECTVSCNRSLAFDTPNLVNGTSRFVIVDAFEISGGGVVVAALPDRFDTAVLDRRALGQIEPNPGPRSTRSAVIWLTGLSGSGKTTVGRWLAGQLRARGMPVEELDGDTIRTLFPQTGFTRTERDQHVRRVGHLASRLEHHGIWVVAALISPYQESREFVRGLCRNFVEVHVSTPLEECERRDTKGLYARARRGEIRNVTGIDDPYEPPVHADVAVDTSRLSVDEAGAKILDAIMRRFEEPGNG